MQLPPGVKRLAKSIFYGSNSKTLRNFEFLSRNLSIDSRILIIGGATQGSGMDYIFANLRRLGCSLVSVDVQYTDCVDALVDAHYLPFADSSFHVVIIQAVLEHVLSPECVVSEIHRVLRLGGVVYSETPFMQCVHEGAYDFTRFTHSGHRWLFRDFYEITSGSHHGAFSSILFQLSYAVPSLLRLSFLSVLLRVLFSRFAKFLDCLLPDSVNIDIACGCYFLGRKSADSILAPSLQGYYRGNI